MTVAALYADGPVRYYAVPVAAEVALVGTTEQVDVTVHWAGQQTTTGRAVRKVQTLTQLATAPNYSITSADSRTRGCRYGTSPPG